MRTRKVLKQSGGFSMLEVLFSASLFSLLSLGLVKGLDVSMRLTKEAQISTALRMLVDNKISEISTLNPLLLDDSNYDDTETGLTFGNLPSITFNRIVNITENADSSKTADITATCTHPAFIKTFRRSILLTEW